MNSRSWMAEGSSRKSGLSSVDSVDSRWVYQDEWSQTVNDGEEEGGGGGAEGSSQLDSDDEDSAEHKLIRTEPKIDPFDVEALEVRGAQTNTFEVRVFILVSHKWG